MHSHHPLMVYLDLHSDCHNTPQHDVIGISYCMHSISGSQCIFKLLYTTCCVACLRVMHSNMWYVCNLFLVEENFILPILHYLTELLPGCLQYFPSKVGPILFYLYCIIYLFIGNLNVFYILHYLFWFLFSFSFPSFTWHFVINLQNEALKYYYFFPSHFFSRETWFIFYNSVKKVFFFLFTKLHLNPISFVGLSSSLLFLLLPPLASEPLRFVPLFCCSLQYVIPCSRN